MVVCCDRKVISYFATKRDSTEAPWDISSRTRRTNHEENAKQTKSREAGTCCEPCKGACFHAEVVISAANALRL